MSVEGGDYLGVRTRHHLLIDSYDDDDEEIGWMMTIDDRDYDDQVKANLARPEEGCWGWQEQVNCTQVKLVVVLLVIIVGIIII